MVDEMHVRVLVYARYYAVTDRGESFRNLNPRLQGRCSASVPSP